MRPEKLYLTDIFEATEAIARFINGIEQETFLNDEIRQSAVILKLIIVGEASARLSDEFRSKYPDVKWRSAIGLRNIVIHEYFGMDWEIIWVTATQDIPFLHEQVKKILESDFKDEIE